MSILSGHEKNKAYRNLHGGDKKLMSYWTSTDTVELSEDIDNGEKTKSESTTWDSTYDSVSSQPTDANDFFSKITVFFTNIKFLSNKTTNIDNSVTTLQNKTQQLENTVAEMGQFLDNMLDKTYPIGSLYFSSKSTSPKTIFGGGTWTRVKDRFILTAGDTYSVGSTGGAATKNFTPSGTISSKSITLNTDNIPAHTHSIPKLSGTAKSDGSHSHTYDYPKWYYPKNEWEDLPDTTPENNYGLGWGNYYGAYSTSTAGAHTHTVETSASTTGSAGKTTAFSHNHTFTGTASSINVLPPYKVYYCWERTA